METTNTKGELGFNPDQEELGHFYTDKGYFKCKYTNKEIRYPLVSLEDLNYCPRCGIRLIW